MKDNVLNTKLNILLGCKNNINNINNIKCKNIYNKKQNFKINEKDCKNKNVDI